MTEQQAIELLHKSELAGRRSAIACSQSNPHWLQLWQAVLQYFLQAAPESHWGTFAYWVGATSGQASLGQVAMQAAFINLCDGSRQSGFLRGLGELFEESAYSRQWQAFRQWGCAQESLWLSLAEAWRSQPPSAGNYWCTNQIVLAWFRIFSPLMSQPGRQALAAATWENLSQHHLPPTHGTLADLPPCLSDCLKESSLDSILVLLENALGQLDVAMLTPFRRRKSANPGTMVPVRLAFYALEVISEHPEWAALLRDRQLRASRATLSACLLILRHLPLARFVSKSTETAEEIAERLPPMKSLLSICLRD